MRSVVELTKSCGLLRDAWHGVTLPKRSRTATGPHFSDLVDNCLKCAPTHRCIHKPARTIV